MSYDKILLKCQQEIFPKCSEIFQETILELLKDYNFLKVQIPDIFDNISLSKARFYTARKQLILLYTWLYNDGFEVTEQISQLDKLRFNDVMTRSKITKSYFRNLDDVLDFVSRIGGKNELLQFKSIVILSWFGVTRDEMVEIRKSDLKTDGFRIVFPIRDPLTLPKKYFDIISKCANADVYQGLNTGRTYTCKQSVYLLRSYKLKKLQGRSISDLFLEFNRFISKNNIHIELNMTELNNNRYLCMIKNNLDSLTEEGDSNSESLLTRVITNSTGCDISRVYWYKDLYASWIDTYYPRKEVPV